MEFESTRSFRQGVRDVHRVLVVGSAGFDYYDDRLSIDSYSWQQLGDIEGIEDYDSIVINLRGFDNPSTVDWQRFYSLFRDEAARKVLAPGGTIYFLGDPRFDIDLKGHRTSGRLPFLYWTGLEFTWHESSGDSVTLRDHSGLDFLMPYCQSIREWTYSNEGVKPLRIAAGFSHVLVQEKPWSFGHRVACSNRFENALVFAISYSDQSIQKGVAYPRGSIVFLPALDITPEENLTYLLEVVFGIDLVTPEPEWVREMEAPGQPPIDEKIEGITQAIEKLEQEKVEAEQNRDECRDVLKLLYTHGNEFEDIVRDVLGKLGTEVEPPVEKNKEDGWITVQTSREMEAVIEIKATRKAQLGEDMLRQLSEWKSRGAMNRKKAYKSLGIGSNQISLPVPSRGAAFSDSFQKSAALQDMIVMTGADLYDIYRLDQLSMLNRDEFWRELFAAKGVFDSSKYRTALRAAGGE